MARTDANHTHGLTEAIERAHRFHELGADILFVEAPKNIDEMRTICSDLPGCKMANIVEGGLTPNLAMDEISSWAIRLRFIPSPAFSCHECYEDDIRPHEN